MSLHFSPTLFLLFLLCYLRNSFHFSLTFLLLCVSLWRFCPWGRVFFCRSVVSFVLTFSIVINAISINFSCYLKLFPPYPTHFCLVEMYISAGLSLSFCCVRAGVSLASFSFRLFCFLLFSLLRSYYVSHVHNGDYCDHRYPLLCMIVLVHFTYTV